MNKHIEQAVVFFGMQQHQTIAEINATWWRRLLLCMLLMALGAGLAELLA